MILFLYGEDTYRSKRKLDEIRAKFLRDIDPSGLNLTQLDGTEATTGEIRGAIVAAPFLAKKRLVVVKDALASAKKKEGEELAAIVADVPDDTILVLYERADAEKLDGEPAYEALKGGKFYPEFKPLGPKEIQNWILDEAKARGVSFSKEGLVAYAPLAGTDCWKISGELDSLASSAKASGSTTIGPALVKSIAHLEVEQSVFDFLDAVGTRRADVAARLMEDLLFQGETEVGLISRLSSHVRGLLVASDLAKEGQVTKDRLAREIGAHPFAAAKIISQSRYYRYEELERLFIWLVDADARLKSGGWPKPRTALDLFLAEIAKEPARH